MKQSQMVAEMLNEVASRLQQKASASPPAMDPEVTTTMACANAIVIAERIVDETMAQVAHNTLREYF